MLPVFSTSGAPVKTSLKPRQLQAWVSALLAVLFFAGIVCGFRVWNYLNQPGKDPLPELLYRCAPCGLGIAGILYVIHFKQTYRLKVSAALVAFLLGAVTSLSAIGLHIWRFGWY